MCVLRTDNVKHNIPYISGVSMLWRVTWATSYATGVILALNFRSRINCTHLLKKLYSSFNLTNYLKIVEKCPFNISKCFFSNFTFCLLNLYKGLDFWFLVAQFTRSAWFWLNAGLHQRDLLSGEGEYHFSGRRNAKIFNCTGVTLQSNKKVKVPGKDRGFL